MRKILPFLVMGILVLSGLGAVALESDIEEFNSGTVEVKNTGGGSRDYTHTVLVEVGTRTTCPSCPASNLAWHSIYEGGNYDFEYTELVYNMNTVAYSRFLQFNPMWVPTSYWDGGEYVLPGTNTATFYSYLDASGSRVVPDLVASLDAEWLGSANIEISYSVVNNDASNYPGHLRIYVLELESTLWNDYNGNPYYHAFLDFPVNQAIDIPAAGNIADTVVWDGAATTTGLGWVGDATALTAAGAVAGGTLGIISATAGADATRVNNWADVGTTDRRILLTNTNTGAGEGFLTVRYVQNNNLS